MNLSDWLKHNNRSQEAFARELGVTQGLVWQWLNGRTGITVDRAKDIVAVTGGEVTPHDLMPDVFPPGFRFPDERRMDSSSSVSAG